MIRPVVRETLSILILDSHDHIFKRLLFTLFEFLVCVFLSVLGTMSISKRREAKKTVSAQVTMTSGFADAELMNRRREREKKKKQKREDYKTRIR